MTHRQLAMLVLLLGYPVIVGSIALLLHFIVFPRWWKGYKDNKETK